MIKAIPLELAESNDFIAKHHRHHPPVHRDKYRIGAEVNGQLVGCVNVGRPVARCLCDGKTLEVVRLTTDGTRDVCSFLYSAAARVAKELGYSKIITYILDSEDGTSLRAAGWHKEANTRGHSWNSKARARIDSAPTCDKQRWARDLT